MQKTIAIIHPDLGIGGAEQLIVNAALALQTAGHDVTIFTPHHDPSRCFPPTKDGTLKVQVRGLFFRSINGRCIALCSLIRMFLCSLYVLLIAGKFDLIIVDQVPGVLPLLKLFPYKVVFYCHFPDLLLCTERGSATKRSYRNIIDKIEEKSMKYPDKILVNSNFTKGVVADTFKDIENIDIMYPCVDLDFKQNSSKPAFLPNNSSFLLSLNRYERKKGVEIAIETYFGLKRENLKLVIAGGYDPRLEENISYLEDLIKRCEEKGLRSIVVEDWKTKQEADVYFLKNLDNNRKEEVLQNAECLLYTPQLEHFGIVPIEAMARGVGVIAWNNGGPTETVVHKSTGFLAKTEEEWISGTQFLLNQNREEIGQNGRAHALKNFSINRMRQALDELAKSI